jgi:beta-lactamase regulating signal transducer with metallopeptidase domain
MYQLFPPHISQALGWTILHSLWQAMLIAIFSAVVLLYLRKKTAKTRYRVVGLSMLMILVSAIATFSWYANYPIETEAFSNDQVSDQELYIPCSDTTISVLARETNEEALQPIAVVQNYFKPHLSLIALIWCFGFAFCLLRLLGHIAQVYYLKTQRNFPADEYWVDIKDNLLQKAGLNKTVELVESAMVRTPILVGHLKPFIMFPIGLINRLDPSEVEAIIAHEVAHIIRRDYLFNILQSLVETIFYYHPAVWWLSNAMRREREIAADELAIALTGNAVNYAKALVVVQELAYFPLSPALAFAGPRKSQLFMRIQHILHSKHSKSFVMEKFFSAGVFLLLLVGLTYAQRGQQAEDKTSGLPTRSVTSPFTSADSTAGIWEGQIKNNELCLTLTRRSKHNNWSDYNCFPVSDFTTLPNGRGTFSMTREAGTISFTGEFDGKEGYGRFSFVEDTKFRSLLSEYNIRNVKESVMIHLFMNDVNRDYLEFLKQKGYKNIDGNELAGLAIHGLDQGTITTYLDMFEKQGKKTVDLDDLMSFKIHEVTNEYIAQINALGFQDLGLDDYLSAKIHDITPEFVQSCKEMGYKNLSFDDVLSFKIHGMSPEYLSQMKDAGYGSLTADEAQSFKIHDVSPEYIASLKAAGFTNLSADDLQGFKIHGITPEYVANLKAAGFTNLNNDEIMAFKIHGVTPEYVASLKAAGISNLDNDEITAFKIHGLTPEVIKTYQQMGFKDLGNEGLISMKIHGITTAFIESFKPVIDSKLTLDQAISLKIHQLTPEFIRNAREKGFTDMDIEEYIQLKIQFGDKLKPAPKRK